MNNYTIAKETFEAGTAANLMQPIEDWLLAQCADLTLAFTNSYTAGGRSGRVYRYRGQSIGLCLSYLGGSSQMVYITPAYNITDTSASYLTSNGCVPTYVNGVRSVGVVLIQGENCAIVGFADTEYSKTLCNMVYMGEVNSEIQGAMMFANSIRNTAWVGIADNSTDSSPLPQVKYSSNEGLGRICKKGESVSNWCLPTTIGAFYTAAAENGQVVATPIFLSTPDLYIEPIRLPDFYQLEGPAMPDYFVETDIGDLNIMRVGNRIMLGEPTA